MFPEWKLNSVIVPSILQLHKSGTKYLLHVRTSPLFDCFKHHLKTHYFTIPWDSNPPCNCPHVRFKFSLNAGALTNLITLHYITQLLVLMWNGVVHKWRHTPRGRAFTLLWRVWRRGRGKSRDLRSFVIQFDFESYVWFEIWFVLMVRFEIIESSALSIVIRKETIGGG